MSEADLRTVLNAAAHQPIPPGLFSRVLKGVERRRAQRRWASAAVAFLALYTFLTFTPNLGAANTLRGGIQPTLFLHISYAEANQLARTPLSLPSSFPKRFPTKPGIYESVPLGPQTDAVLIRWLANEMVIVHVEDQVRPGVKDIHFDLRRSTLRWGIDGPPIPDVGHRKEPVKVGSYDGFAYFWSVKSAFRTEEAFALDWTTETHHYRLVVPGAETVEKLLELASQIK